MRPTPFRTAVLALSMAMPLATPSHAIDRRDRVVFNLSLPPGCVSGWFGRGIGTMAVCTLGGRSQVRFIDGMVFPCGDRQCLDHSVYIEGFLAAHGF